MSELLCKQCKHAFRTLGSLPIWGSGAEWRCRRAFVGQALEYNPVKGYEKVPAHYQRCMTARGSYSDAVCGPEGKLWEPKSKKFFFLAIKHSDR